MKRKIIFWTVAVLSMIACVAAAAVLHGRPARIAPGENRLWFYDMGGEAAFAADLIVVESDGRFGLIDTGNRRASEIEDADGTVYEIPEDLHLSNSQEGRNGADAMNYLAEALGITHLDFILGTHAHSDHLGGLPEIAELTVTGADGAQHALVDENTVYLYKAYHHIDAKSDDLPGPEDEQEPTVRWHSQAFAWQAVNAVESRGGLAVDLSAGKDPGQEASEEEYREILAALVEQGVFMYASYRAGDAADPEDNRLSLTFGSLTLDLYHLFGVAGALDENVNSVAAVITDGRSRFFTAGDLDTQFHTEQKVAAQVAADYGSVDGAKASHHGYAKGSNSKEWYDLLKPELIVTTSSAESAEAEASGGYANLLYHAKKTVRTAFYETAASERGLVVTFAPRGLTVRELRGEASKAGLGSAEKCRNRMTFREGWARWDTEYLTAEDSEEIDWYFFRKGRWVTGWLESGDAVYYLKDDGRMAAGETLEIDGETYTFGADGKLSGEGR